MGFRWCVPLCVLLVSSVAGLAQGASVARIEEDVPEANPGRPTVSTPATLTPVGYLQFENGGLYAANSPEFSTRLGVNQVTKLALNSRVQLLLLTEPLVHSRMAGDRENHPGEVFGGVQGVLLSGRGKVPTVAMSYIGRIHASPAPELDLGTFRQGMLVLVSDDLMGFHFDLNGMLNEQTEGAVRRGQFGQSLSVSHAVGRATMSGELWHFTQPLTGGNAVGTLWATSYALRRNLIVDAGFDHGLTGSSTQWEGFAGFTYLLPRRLWRR